MNELFTCWNAASFRASVSPAASSRAVSSPNLASRVWLDLSRLAHFWRSAANSSLRPRSFSSSVLAVELNWMDLLGILEEEEALEDLAFCSRALIQKVVPLLNA